MLDHDCSAHPSRRSILRNRAVVAQYYTVKPIFLGIIHTDLQRFGFGTLSHHTYTAISNLLQLFGLVGLKGPVVSSTQSASTCRHYPVSTDPLSTSTGRSRKIHSTSSCPVQQSQHPRARRRYRLRQTAVCITRPTALIVQI